VVEASESAVEKAEAVILIDQKVLVKRRILQAFLKLLRMGQTINTRAVLF